MQAANGSSDGRVSIPAAAVCSLCLTIHGRCRRTGQPQHDAADGWPGGHGRHHWEPSPGHVSHREDIYLKLQI